MPAPQSPGHPPLLDTAQEKRHARWTAAAYAAMILVTAGLFLVIRSYGETLIAPPLPAGQASVKAPANASDVVPHVLFALAAVIVAGQLIGRIFAFVGQPPV